MFLTLLFGFLTSLGVLLALPKTRRWLLSVFHVFGQDEKTSIGAKVFVYRREDRIYHLAEIYNAGPENIIDLKVIINWENDQGKQNKEIHKFIDDGADPLWARPHDCHILDKEKRILIVDFPFKNLIGLVKVNIKGKTHTTEKELNCTFKVQ